MADQSEFLCPNNDNCASDMFLNGLKKIISPEYIDKLINNTGTITTPSYENTEYPIQFLIYYGGLLTFFVLGFLAVGFFAQRFIQYARTGEVLGKDENLNILTRPVYAMIMIMPVKYGYPFIVYFILSLVLFINGFMNYVVNKMVTTNLNLSLELPFVSQIVDSPAVGGAKKATTERVYSSQALPPMKIKNNLGGSAYLGYQHGTCLKYMSVKGNALIPKPIIGNDNDYYETGDNGLSFVDLSRTDVMGFGSNVNEAWGELLNYHSGSGIRGSVSPSLHTTYKQTTSFGTELPQCGEFRYNFITAKELYDDIAKLEANTAKLDEFTPEYVEIAKRSLHAQKARLIINAGVHNERLNYQLYAYLAGLNYALGNGSDLQSSEYEEARINVIRLRDLVHTFVATEINNNILSLDKQERALADKLQVGGNANLVGLVKQVYSGNTFTNELVSPLLGNVGYPSLAGIKSIVQGTGESVTPLVISNYPLARLPVDTVSGYKTDDANNTTTPETFIAQLSKMVEPLERSLEAKQLRLLTNNVQTPYNTPSYSNVSHRYDVFFGGASGLAELQNLIKQNVTSKGWLNLPSMFRMSRLLGAQTSGIGENSFVGEVYTIRTNGVPLTEVFKDDGWLGIGLFGSDGADVATKFKNADVFVYDSYTKAMSQANNTPSMDLSQFKHLSTDGSEVVRTDTDSDSLLGNPIAEAVGLFAQMEKGIIDKLVGRQDETPLEVLAGFKEVADRAKAVELGITSIRHVVDVGSAVSHATANSTPVIGAKSAIIAKTLDLGSEALNRVEQFLSKIHMIFSTIPMMFNSMYVLASYAYYIAIVITMIAGIFYMLIHARPDKEFIGQNTQIYLMMLNILLTPFLLVAGYLVSIGLFGMIVPIATELWFADRQSIIASDTGLTGFIGMFTNIKPSWYVLGTTFMMLAHISYSLVNELRDNVLQLMGTSFLRVAGEINGERFAGQAINSLSQAGGRYGAGGGGGVTGKHMGALKKAQEDERNDIKAQDGRLASERQGIIRDFESGAIPEEVAMQRLNQNADAYGKLREREGLKPSEIDKSVEKYNEGRNWDKAKENARLIADHRNKQYNH